MKMMWKLHADEQQIGWLHFDVPKSSANTLSPQALEQLDRMLDEISNSELKGLVILSDKERDFIVGADIEVFTRAVTTELAEAFMSAAHAVFMKLEKLSIPTLALIHGNCLGGGLELSLACDYRIAEEKAKLGFPEVFLGIFPGFGGSVRSIEQVGVIQAMTMMLSGRAVKARQAKKTGLVDEVVPQRQLLRAARQVILQAKGQRAKRVPLQQRLLLSPLGRKFVAKVLRKKTKALVNPEHYAAPFALIDLWEKHGGNREKMFQHEVEAVAKLIVTPEAQNLVRLFFLQERLKGFGKGAVFKTDHIHVIGAGVMGADIGAWCALQGIKVTIQDQNLEVIATAVKRAAALFQKKLFSAREQQAAMDLFIPDLAGEGVKRADIVLEAIVENLEIKQALYQSLEPKMKSGAILATNTSGIPIDQLAEVLDKPQRLVGIHFFNPVAKMKLVEIIAGKTTEAATLQHAYAFVTRIRHLPLPVKSAPGFLVNRILMPYLMEAITMIDEGLRPEAIDQAVLDFGMPMGPVTLADRVGLDVCLAVAKDLSGITDDKVPDYLLRWVKEGRLGLKSGHGFYLYKKGKAQQNKGGAAKGYDADLTNRLILRIVNEAVRCLDEGIVEDAELLDAGMVFGTGFAPFRGGVMRYLEEQGKDNLLAKLVQMEQKYGSRFRAAEGWQKI